MPQAYQKAIDALRASVTALPQQLAALKQAVAAHKIVAPPPPRQQTFVGTQWNDGMQWMKFESHGDMLYAIAGSSHPRPGTWTQKGDVLTISVPGFGVGTLTINDDTAKAFLWGSEQEGDWKKGPAPEWAELPTTEN